LGSPFQHSPCARLRAVPSTVPAGLERCRYVAGSGVGLHRSLRVCPSLIPLPSAYRGVGREAPHSPLPASCGPSFTARGRVQRLGRRLTRCSKTPLASNTTPAPAITARSTPVNGSVPPEAGLVPLPSVPAPQSFPWAHVRAPANAVEASISAAAIAAKNATIFMATSPLSFCLEAVHRPARRVRQPRRWSLGRKSAPKASRPAGRRERPCCGIGGNSGSESV
jgi:hypothetical protein